jgi:signal transduction histidine kinase
MLGFTREELLAKAIADLVVPEEVPRLVQRMAATRSGAIDVTEWVLRRKDGTLVPVEVSTKVLPDGRRKAILRDISERKRVEREQQFLARFGSVLASTVDFEATSQAIAKLIADDLADLCLVHTWEEPAMGRQRVVVQRDPRKAALARELEQLDIDYGRPFLGSSVIETQKVELMSPVLPAYLDWVAQSDEDRRVLRELEPTSLVALPLLIQERLVGTLVLIRTTGHGAYRQEDLPFLKQLALRSALVLEKARLYHLARRAIRMRDDVLGIVAHDLRSPLHTILMQVALLSRPGADPERQQKPREVVERAVKRMNRLIQDLLDVTRMEAGTLAVDRACFSAQQIISDALQAQEALAADASIELRLELPRELPEVWADRDRLLQVFENLLGNALKFTKAGGRIEVGAVPRGNEVLFWVADTGAGIHGQDLPHVFERFWQRQGERHRGAGLGLPIVKGIVEAHGGRVWVESTLGRGSTFFFAIPAPRAEELRERARHDA